MFVMRYLNTTNSCEITNLHFFPSYTFTRFKPQVKDNYTLVKFLCLVKLLEKVSHMKKDT